MSNVFLELIKLEWLDELITSVIKILWKLNKYDVYTSNMVKEYSCCLNVFYASFKYSCIVLNSVYIDFLKINILRNMLVI